MPLPPLEPSGRISRRDLALHPGVWLTVAAVFATVGVATAAIPVLWPSMFPSSRLWPVAGLLLAVAATTFLTAPPQLGSLRGHAIILALPVCTALAIVAYAPAGVVPVAAAMFVGALGPSRLRSRRAITAHLLIAALLLLSTLAFADLDRVAIIALASTIPAMLVLGFCTVMVLEASETQGAELQRLVRHDPLTAVGNERFLAERLQYELQPGQSDRRTLSILALDLDRLAEHNERLGTSAGDALLQAAAVAIEAAVTPRDTVARTGGDEFCILMPGGTADDARATLTRIRTALGAISTGGRPLTCGAGIAVFPADATSADLLLETADTRLSLDKADRTEVVSDLAVWEPTRVAPTAPSPLGSEPRLDAVAGLVRVRRDDIAANRAVWLATGAMFSLYAVALGVLWALSPERALGGAVACGLFGVLAAVVLASEPPPVRSWRNHVVVASPAVTFAVVETLVPQASGVLLGALLFAGPLVAFRLTDRRHAVIHGAIATVLAATLVGTGVLDTAMTLAVLLALITIWTLGITDMVYLEAAEAQAEELEQIVRRDTVTGLGNRRHLVEQLDGEIRRHRRLRRPLTMVAVELAGFAEYVESRGAAAGDELLRAASRALRAIVGDTTILVRESGGQFSFILTGTRAADTTATVNAIRVAVQQLSDETPALRAAIGHASFPADAPDAEVLLHVVSWRRHDDGRPGSVAGGRRASDAAQRPLVTPDAAETPFRVVG